MGDFVATAAIDIGAPATEVWKALTDPQSIAKYFFGARVQTDWRPGSPIVWMGTYNGKPFEDKGRICEVEPNRRLEMTHYSPMSGLPDEPSNYHTLTFELDERGVDTTHVTLSQDNNGDQAEADRATANWTAMLQGLKATVESG